MKFSIYLNIINQNHHNGNTWCRQSLHPNCWRIHSVSRVIVHGFIPINRKCLILIFLIGWIIGHERPIFMELTCPVWSLIPRSLFPVSIAIIKLQNQIISCMAMNQQLFLKLKLNQTNLVTYTKSRMLILYHFNQFLSH